MENKKIFISILMFQSNVKEKQDSSEKQFSTKMKAKLKNKLLLRLLSLLSKDKHL